MFIYAPFRPRRKGKTLQGHLRLYSYLDCFDKKKPNDVRRTFIIVYGEDPPSRKGTDFLSDALDLTLPTKCEFQVVFFFQIKE